jgi:hypothetical protein
MIQEQYGFALNRSGRKEDAVNVLQKLIDDNGPNSETCGILGRVYKDRYNEMKASKPAIAAGYLDKAIETYLMGYKADLRDFYPGVNAVNLLYLKKDPAAVELAKVVEFSVVTHLEKKSKKLQRHITSSFDDYWPYAALLALSVVQDNRDNANKYLTKCLVTPNEPWQRTTTANDLKLYSGEKEWVGEIIKQLEE